MAGETLRTIPAPLTDPWGVAYYNGVLWHTDFNSDSVYRLNPSDGSVIESFTVVDNFGFQLTDFREIAVDSSFFYLTTWDNDEIWRYNREAQTYDKRFFGPGDGGMRGICTDGSFLWVYDTVSDTIFRISNFDGTIDSQFVITVSQDIYDLAHDGTWLYASDNAGNYIHRIDPATGSIQESIAMADVSAPRGITYDAGQMFVCEYLTNAEMIYIVSVNQVPNAPSLDYPVGSVTIDRTVDNVFDWTFSDPDEGDSQSQYEFRYRVSGTTTWTTVTVETTATQRTVTANTLTVDDYEWQVRTWDSLGDVGPWSASGFFTAADPPPGPTITDPVNGAIIPSDPYTVLWSASEQEAYQLRRVADDAGVADTATVYSDTGTITSTARQRSVAFPVTGRFEHVQLRVQRAGIWSDWASSRVDVDYTPPAIPTVELTEEPAKGRILVAITNPTPGAGEPTVTGNDLLRQKTGASGWTMIANGIAANGSYNDYTPASDQGYDYKVIAHGDNTTTSESAVVSSSGITLRYLWLHDPADPGETVRQFRFNREGGAGNWKPEVAFNSFAGRARPLAEFGEGESFRIKVRVELADAGDWEAAEDLIRAKVPLCYRDSSGRKAFGVIESEPITSAHYGGSLALSFVAIDYSEDVG